jgi:hypothetical protein
MPLYFFHCEGAQNFIDDRGTELPDLRAARIEAVQNAGEILKDHADRFAEALSWRVYVTDDVGATVFALKLSVEVPDDGVLHKAGGG